MRPKVALAINGAFRLPSMDYGGLFTNDSGIRVIKAFGKIYLGKHNVLLTMNWP
jgi:hypothetical protein